MLTRTSRLAVLAGLGLAGWLAAAEPIPLQDIGAGRARLLDEPAARFGYRLDGAAAEVVLGDYWHGNDRVSGVWFEPHGAVDAEGRRALFVHCPWRTATGAAFVDFRLALPDLAPLRLEFSTALRADAPASDGVTCRVRVDGAVRFETHCIWKAAQVASVDLAPFRGQTVLLRLEADPGPARNARDDWFLWGLVDVVAGSPAQIAAADAERVQREQAAVGRELVRAQARAAESLVPLSSREARALTPSTLAAVATSSRLAETAWVFTAQDGTDLVRYELRPEPDTGGDIPIAVTLNGTPILPPPFVLQLRPLAGREESAEPMRLLRSESTGEGASRGLTLRCGEAGAERVITLSAAVSGKTLRVTLAAPAGHFGGVQLSRRGGRAVPAVYALTPSMHYGEADGYGSGSVDLWHASATDAGENGTTYRPLTDGSYRELHDEFVVTVSSRYEETLLNPPHPPSPFLPELADRVLLDAWEGSFDDDAQWFRDMARYGLDRLLVIKHVWQRDGYDQTYPNVFPANAAQGGDAALRRLATTAATLGHRFCVHENFYDYYPNAEDFRAEDCALQSNGARIAGWDVGPVKAVIMKPSRVLDYARRFSPPIVERYGCTAAYHDIMPNWNVDCDAAVADSGMIRVTHEVTRQLCEFDRGLYGGPVLFEAGEPVMAGVYDGGTANGAAIEDYPLLPVHELLKVHPKMSNHGMSYYERWLRWGYGPGWSSYVMTDRELDRYRAMTIAFGRTGFIGHQLLKHAHGVVREYWLMRAFARAYTNQQAEAIRYAAATPADTWLDAATAARYGTTQRLWVTYEGGQEVAVNVGAEPWVVQGLTLPPHGAMTRGPRATAWTALVDGQIADYAEVAGTIYADARSQIWQPEERLAPIRAEAADFADLGQGRFRLGVRWLPGRTPERDVGTFWHFIDTGIVFQSDHPLGVRTTQWRPGEAVLDGPLELALPAATLAESLRVEVGLYDRQGRLALAGGQDTLAVGRLRIGRRDGKVTALTFEPADRSSSGTADPARYLTDANLDKRVLRFPTLATDGAVVMRRTPAGVELVPVPLSATVKVGLPGRFTAVTVLAADGTAGARTASAERDGLTWFTIGGDAGTERWRAVPAAAAP